MVSVLVSLVLPEEALQPIRDVAAKTGGHVRIPLHHRAVREPPHSPGRKKPGPPRQATVPRPMSSPAHEDATRGPGIPAPGLTGHHLVATGSGARPTARALSQFLSHSPPPGTVHRRPPPSRWSRSQTVTAYREQRPAVLVGAQVSMSTAISVGTHDRSVAALRLDHAGCVPDCLFGQRASADYACGIAALMRSRRTP